MSVELYLKERNTQEAIQECLRQNLFHLGLLLAKQSPKKHKHTVSTLTRTSNMMLTDKEPFTEDTSLIHVKLLCNWTDTESLTEVWNKMSMGNYQWNNIRLVTDNKEPDYYVIINAAPPSEKYIPSKTIVFHMEPFITTHNKDRWGEWGNIEKSTDFLNVITHEKGYNNLEWHLSSTWSQLKNTHPTKTKCLSTVLSSKYSDIGHIQRIDFVKYLETTDLSIDVYGDNAFNYKKYIKSLPYHQKDEAIFPYEYTFNAENNIIPNYVTEKLIDGILGECLVFYSGCPNISTIINEKAYVQIDLTNPDECYQIMSRAIQEDWWSQRIEIIRAVKMRILDELQFFPRLEKLLKA